MRRAQDELYSLNVLLYFCVFEIPRYTHASHDVASNFPRRVSLTRYAVFGFPCLTGPFRLSIGQVVWLVATYRDGDNLRTPLAADGRRAAWRRR